MHPYWCVQGYGYHNSTSPNYSEVQTQRKVMKKKKKDKERRVPINNFFIESLWLGLCESLTVLLQSVLVPSWSMLSKLDRDGANSVESGLFLASESYYDSIDWHQVDLYWKNF